MAEEDNSSGDSVDAFSDKFDSFKALYSDKVRVPVPEAPLFDNISKFETVVLKGHVTKASDSDTRRKKEGESSSRRFLPHQGLIQGHNRWQSKYSDRNVIDKMQKCLGPLAVLYQYMENKTRVKVYTRDASGLRGHVEAYVAAFDRHWNLALEDCLELWHRKLKRKAPALGDLACRVKSSSDTGPKVIVKQRNGKLETLERHVPQLLLRGEQVALIVKID